MKNNESLFKARYPDVFSRYKLYQRYYFLKTGRDFMVAKDYDSVLIKSIIAYFVYHRERGNKATITLKSVADLLGYKDHTGVLYAINRIKILLITQSSYKISGQSIKDYFLIFSGIFYKSKFQKKKSNDRISNRNIEITNEKNISLNGSTNQSKKEKETL